MSGLSSSLGNKYALNPKTGQIQEYKDVMSRAGSTDTGAGSAPTYSRQWGAVKDAVSASAADNVDRTPQDKVLGHER